MRRGASFYLLDEMHTGTRAGNAERELLRDFEDDVKFDRHPKGRLAMRSSPIDSSNSQPSRQSSCIRFSC
jgi:hypothetical protein